MGCSNSNDNTAASGNKSQDKYNNNSTDISAASPTAVNDPKSPTAPQKKQNTWMMDGESGDSDSDGGDFTTPARKESGLQIKHDLKLTNTNSSKRRASTLVAHSSLPESAGAPRGAEEDDAAGEDEVVLFDSDNDEDDGVGIAGKSHPMGNKKQNDSSLNTSSRSTTFSDSREDGKHRPLGKSGKTTSKLASLIAVRHDGEDEENCGGEAAQSPSKDSIEEVAL